MTWTDARRINTTAFSIGAGWENKVLAMLIALSKDKELSKTDVAIAIAFIQKELDKVLEEELKALENVIPLSYNYTTNAALMELSSITGTFPSLAKGYSGYWCKDGKDAKARAIANMTNIKNEIAGLLLGGASNLDPIVVMGLIHDILTKAENEWKRLLRTEIEASFSQGLRDAYLMKGARTAVIENDNPCDAICAEMVGEHEVSLDGALGIDLPPYHPNCQCVFLGIF